MFFNSMLSIPNIKIQVRKVDVKIKRGLRRVVKKLEKIEKVILEPENKNPSL